MTMPPRSVIGKLSVAALLVLSSALARAANHAPSAPHSPAAAVDMSAPPRFQISGRVSGLFPGAHARLRLSLRNPNPFAIVVTRIRTTVLRASGACPPKTIRIWRFSGSRRIPASGVTRVAVRVRMRPSTPDACAGQRYRLNYRGWATFA